MRHEHPISRPTVLTAETRHRLFNILQMISALVRLRIRRCQSQEARAQLAWVLEAVSTIARLQRGLDEAGQMGLHAHLAEQAALWRQIARDQGIALRADLDRSVVVPPGAAVPVALIVQELITNSFEHAFPHGRRGTISLSLRRDADGAVTVAVRDDGQGLPPCAEAAGRSRSGLRIARGLAETVGAEFEMAPERPHGTLALVRLARG
jgi:two-component sensor histidine kinase